MLPDTPFSRQSKVILTVFLTMLELNVDSIRRFHAQLRLVSEAGIELELFGPKILTRSELDSRLVGLEMRLGSAGDTAGESPEKLLQELRRESDVAERYIPALLCWIGSDGAADSLLPLAKEAIERKRSEGQDLLLFFYPVIWGVAAGLVLLFVCFVLAPNFIALAEQLRHQSLLFDAMYWMRDNTAWLFPLYVLFFVVAAWCYLRSGLRSSSIREKQSFLRRSAQAKQYAALIGTKGAEVKPGELSGLLAWAVSAEGSEQQQTKLEFASQVYASVFELESQRRRSLAPTRLAVIAGGVLVALVGAFVFGPIVELMFLVIQSTGGNA